MNECRFSLCFSPSSIGAYFESHCKRNLAALTLMTLKTNDEKWENSYKKNDALDDGPAEAGKVWEDEVLNNLTNVWYANSEKPKEQFSYDKTEETLKRLGEKNKEDIEEIYMYQMCLLGDGVYLGVDKESGICWGNDGYFYPDIIKATKDGGRYKLSIVDIKSSAALKEGYQVQIALYAKMLDKMLNEIDPERKYCYVNLEKGYVWNKEKILIENNIGQELHEEEKGEVRHEIKEREFSLKEPFDALDELLKPEEIGAWKRYLSTDEKTGEDLKKHIIESVPCITSPACDFCGIRENCIKGLKGEKRIQAMPNITEAAQKTAMELGFETYEKAFGLLTEVDKATDSNNISDEAKLLLTDKYWQDVRWNIKSYKAALGGGNERRFPKDGSTKGFPKESTYSLLLTAQKDVETGKGYVLGYRLIGEGISENIENIFIAASKDKEADVEIEFANGLFELLYGNDSVIKEGNTLQAFVMDPYEKMNIMNSLLGILDQINRQEKDDDEKRTANIVFKMDKNDALIYRKTQKILFWLQDERMTSYSDKLPKAINANPVSVVSAAINRLYVVKSEDVRPDICDIAEAFGYKVTDKSFSEYVGIFNALNSKKIKEYWDSENKEELLKGIKDNISIRFDILSRVITTIQNDANVDQKNILKEDKKGIVLSNNAEEFKDYSPSDFKIDDENNEIWVEDFDRIKAKMIYVNNFEDSLQLKHKSNTRVKCYKSAKESGEILRLTFTGIEESNSTSENTQEGTAEKVFKIENYDTFKGNMWYGYIICKIEDNEDSIKRFVYSLDDQKVEGEKDDTGFYVYEDGEKKVHYYHSTVRSKPEPSHYDNVDGYVIKLRDIPTSEDLSQNDSFLMFERHFNRNISKTRKGIEGGKTEDIINSLMESNNEEKREALSDFGDPDDIIKYYSSPDGKEFSDSQKKAFEHLLKSRLTILVGPPAAGKTDFIARSIYTLATTRYFKDGENGKGLKVLVSAMSHAAIDNVLNALLKKISDGKNGKQSKEIPEDYIGLFKATKFESSELQASNAVKIIKTAEDWKREIVDGCQAKTCVVGATSWALYNKFTDADGNFDPSEEDAFDLIIIDEASQVRAIDSFLQLGCGHNNTRFLLVGDNDQLPPIINGNYDPEAKQVRKSKDENCKAQCGRINVYGSVFEMYLSALGMENSNVIRLNDNFRMNDILCRYSAIKIYDVNKNEDEDKYKAYNSNIGRQTLNDLKEERDRCEFKLGEKPDAIENEFIDDILTPEYPLVFIKISGTINDQRDLEVKLVNQIVNRFWKRTINAKLNPNPTKKEKKDYKKAIAEFWNKNEYCGIISPYHEQIGRLKGYIAKTLKCNKDELFIGTVDKLQGQERELIIVSYGMYDPERLKNESEFIFSKNRFNVSLTRGKKKTIVILSDVISTPNLTSNVLRNKSQAMADGVDFIHGFADYMCKDTEGDNYHRYEGAWVNDATVEIFAKKTRSEAEANVPEEVKEFKNQSVEEIVKYLVESIDTESNKVLLITSPERIVFFQQKIAEKLKIYPINIKLNKGKERTYKEYPLIELVKNTRIQIMANTMVDAKFMIDDSSGDIRKDIEDLKYNYILIDDGGNRTMKKNYKLVNELLKERK